MSVYVCCAEFPLLNCPEAEQHPSVNQAERAVYPSTGSRKCQGDHIAYTQTHIAYLTLSDSEAHTLTN